MNRTALFDLDGTLIDSEPGIMRCMHHGLAAVGITVTDEAIRVLIGIPLPEMFLALGTPADKVDLAVGEYRKIYSSGAMYEAIVFDGIPEALAELKADGWTLAVATSKPEGFARDIADHFDIAKYFDVIAGATLDGRIRVKADVITFALEHLNPDRTMTVMIGDRAEDLVGAAAHELKSVGVAWGFGTEEELAAHNPAAILDRTDQLAKTLNTLF